MRPSHAPARSSRAATAASRMAGAAGALLLQGGFLLLFLASMPVLRPPPEIGRELSLVMPRLLPMPPRPPARGQALPGPAMVTPQLPLPPNALAPRAQQIPPPAALSGIQGFGQALNGCAPEKYNSLPPDLKARCPKPGEGVAIQELPNLMGAPSHVKDEAHWEDEWAREQSPPLLPCGGFVNIACLLTKIADGSWRDFGDPAKWPHYAVKQLPKEELYKVQQAHDAWNKEHAPSLPQDAGTGK